MSTSKCCYWRVTLYNRQLILKSLSPTALRACCAPYSRSGRLFFSGFHDGTVICLIVRGSQKFRFSGSESVPRVILCIIPEPNNSCNREFLACHWCRNRAIFMISLISGVSLGPRVPREFVYRTPGPSIWLSWIPRLRKD